MLWFKIWFPWSLRVFPMCRGLSDHSDHSERMSRGVKETDISGISQVSVESLKTSRLVWHSY